MDESYDVVILAGGKGSRLKPYTTVLPKPLIPVCDIPILEVVIHQLASEGFTRIILAVNYLEALLRSYFGDGERYGIRIHYSKELSALGTIGPIRLVRDRVAEHFLVMNGDLLTDLSFRKLLDEHTLSGHGLTVTTSPRTVQIPGGVIDADENGFIHGFREKPTVEFSMAAGIYAMSRNILDYVPPDQPFGMDQLIFALLDAGVPIRTHRHTGDWYDIGCPEDLDHANEALSQHRDRFLSSHAAPHLPQEAYAP